MYVLLKIIIMYVCMYVCHQKPQKWHIEARFLLEKYI